MSMLRSPLSELVLTSAPFVPAPQPDAYWFSYLGPGERAVTGEWSAAEMAELQHLALEHTEKVASGAWGLFSMHVWVRAPTVAR